ncbi:MAG: hypothetical protein GC155_12805 [Alphaproteobacteria bacterium]|nr:hypothetical protein [Alphaproteobacteria bacterium]
MKRLLYVSCFALAACAPPQTAGTDWRAVQIADAEAQMRIQVVDRDARFFDVQMTGDQHTGQTCGKVKSKNGKLARFIVYIDKSAGPFVEDHQGKQYISPHDFDFQWKYDCLKEGYDPTKHSG